MHKIIQDDKEAPCCSICGGDLINHNGLIDHNGYDAWPINKGRCCFYCDTHVAPAS